MPKKGCPYGSHRVLAPAGLLPQAAAKLDNGLPIYDNEILVDVATLNVDSASFTQIEDACGKDPDRMAAMILSIVAERGKMQNPVTGSGGVLIGTVAEVGPRAAAVHAVAPGDEIVTLVSLSTTPLVLDRITAVRLETDQVDVAGKAVLFEKTVFAKLPPDMPRKLALSVLDVAGAAPQTERLVKPGDTVFVLGGGGKSGMLCCYAARKRAGESGMVIGTGHSARSTERLRALGLCDHVVQVDATNPLAVERAVRELTGGRMADVTINCVNIDGTEMGAILATKPDGTIYFFSMATSFTRAALGAEGIGYDVTMLIGNGYATDHAAKSLDIMRESEKMRRVFEELYA
ncbi:MAG: zinc-binding dehydrogenase [Kiritimatiellae bacterium]|nr:zinc-binding dehydrogenase [Kiritimatiellia bacterium]